MAYRVEIVNTVNTPTAELETIKIGLKSGFGLRTTHVMVFEGERPYVHLECFTKSDDYHFRNEALVWRDVVAIGVGHRLCILVLKDKSAKAIDLGAYFGYFYTTESVLLVASGRRVHAIGLNGELIWIADNLGIDGVVIDRIDGSIAYGEGEFDPPGGWKPFRLDLTTGQTEWIVKGE